MLTTIIFFCFLLGCVAGLRTFTAPAVVCWGAHLGWLHFAGTGFGFIDYMVTLIIFTLLALGELISDKLPKTPARTTPPQLIGRILFGGFAGAALSVGAGGALMTGLLAGAVGAAIGTFAGYHMRHALVTQLRLPDLPVAIMEDLLAIAGGLFLVSHI
ncbi:putative membrane protein [Edaphobacter aggregans]|jgi:uncharacterized membrane protein|uniref:Putative membrane protein n=1 Tax=Edaphobacter aggregans TaxID=570835 RepID=A0A428MEC7_9BACT|nr:DUF4126 domain-containing protein [Edaphobacter aggregans]RSL15226.1 putative membrane protein [Edaphobacter aggregans]